MPVLIAAVVLVGSLCTLDLLLTLGVIKRLKEHTALLSKMAAGSPGRPPVVPVGQEVGDFTAVAVGGEVLTRESLAGETLVAFFSPSCEPCHEMLPKFVAHARAVSGGRDQVLAVVVGTPDRAEEQVAELAPVARVVVESGSDAKVSDAFGIKGFPTLLEIARNEDGRQVVAGNQVDLDSTAVVA
ncbi:redoxin domain-containing protein [Streptomyces olivoreticuli]|uniref:TlpA family protein disulfide reductase n=1 Tax=Streptomyces olivoreticuli TaxID=68246 RepID=UPI000E238A15|nr:redoxin domain-containing protein [Streptomyces olivoreticuli]